MLIFKIVGKNFGRYFHREGHDLFDDGCSICVEYPEFWIYQKNYWIEIYRRIKYKIKCIFSPKIKISGERVTIDSYPIPDSKTIKYDELNFKSNFHILERVKDRLGKYSHEEEKMKAEHQVCNLELSRRLKELGVKQDSLHYWGNTVGQKDQTCWRIEPKIEDTMMEYISAFTVAELGDILPNGAFSVRCTDGKQYIAMDSFNGRLMCEHDNKWDRINDVYGDTEADARAKMLIYLIENKLMEVEV